MKQKEVKSQLEVAKIGIKDFHGSVDITGNPKYRCPVCGAESFEVTAHVTQDWKIDYNGSFLEALDECVEVTHYPNEEDIWCCANCDFSAEGRKFRCRPNEEVQQ